MQSLWLLQLQLLLPILISTAITVWFNIHESCVVWKSHANSCSKSCDGVCTYPRMFTSASCFEFKETTLSNASGTFVENRCNPSSINGTIDKRSHHHHRHHQLATCCRRRTEQNLMVTTLPSIPETYMPSMPYGIAILHHHAVLSKAVHHL
jgi:hypothetical protein